MYLSGESTHDHKKDLVPVMLNLIESPQGVYLVVTGSNSIKKSSITDSVLYYVSHVRIFPCQHNCATQQARFNCGGDWI